MLGLDGLLPLPEDLGLEVLPADSAVATTSTHLPLARPVLSAHADAQVDVRGALEAEALAHGPSELQIILKFGKHFAFPKFHQFSPQVKRLHVEDLLERVGLVGPDIRLEGLLCTQVEEVICPDELLELWLDVGDLAPLKLELVEWHPGTLQVALEAELLRSEHEQCPATPSLPTGSAAHPMDVLLRVIRWVKLDNPVHIGDVQPAGSYVRAQKGPRVSVAELEERCGALRLLLLALLDKKNI